MTKEQLGLLAQFIDIKCRAAEMRAINTVKMVQGYAIEAIKLEKEADEIMKQLIK